MKEKKMYMFLTKKGENPKKNTKFKEFLLFFPPQMCKNVVDKPRLQSQLERLQIAAWKKNFGA